LIYFNILKEKKKKKKNDLILVDNKTKRKGIFQMLDCETPIYIYTRIPWKYYQTGISIYSFENQFLCYYSSSLIDYNNCCPMM